MLKLFNILSMEKSYYPRIFSIDLNVNQCDYYLISAAILERFGHFLIGFGCTRSGSPNKSCVDQCQWYEEKNSLWVKINDLKKDTCSYLQLCLCSFKIFSQWTNKSCYSNSGCNTPELSKSRPQKSPNWHGFRSLILGTHEGLVPKTPLERAYSAPNLTATNNIDSDSYRHPK